MAQIPNARKDLPYLLLEFNKKYGNPRIPFIAVVEGEDESYYRPRVASQIADPNPLEFIAGEGKTNVMDLLTMVQDDKETYDENRYLFFVDQDYDPIADCPRCYVTPKHSVENFYVSEVAFRNLARSAFKLFSHDSERDLEDLVSLYALWSASLTAATLDFNAWLIWQLSEATDASGEPPKLNLNGIKLNDLFRITFVGRTITITPVFDIANPSEIFPGSIPFNMARFQQIRNDLLQKDFFTYFRGKFALQFLSAVLNHLRNDSRQVVPLVFRQPRKTTLSWSNQILAEFSSFAETPVCLVNFMRQFVLRTT